MEDKAFELMSKMYSDMQNGFTNINTRLDKIELIQEEIKTKVLDCRLVGKLGL